MARHRRSLAGATTSLVAVVALLAACAATTDGVVRGYLPACRPQPGHITPAASGRVTLLTADGRRVGVERVVRHHAWAFTVPPGTYRVVPRAPGVQGQQVTVHSGQITTVQLAISCP